MTFNYTQLTQNYLAELEKRKVLCQEEIEELNVAITSARSLLGVKLAEKPRNVPKESKKTKKITERMVRDAVIYISKNPVDRKNRFPVEEGFFTQSHINEFMGVFRYNPSVKAILDKMVSKGILETRKYKNGLQYRYIKPDAATSVAVKEVKKYKQENRSQPIPRTGNNYHTIRNKDIEKAIKSAESQGFIISRLGSDHIRVSKEGKFTTISTTGADKARGVENTRAALKRIGVEL
jgi:hypothetical protein